MERPSSALNWFEIPVVDFGRAKKFYETVLGVELYVHELGGFTLGVFPCDQLGIGGAICKGEHYTPSADGSMVYLNAMPDLQPAADRVEAAGGQLLIPKTEIGNGWGYSALFIDSEGNKVGLHSMS